MESRSSDRKLKPLPPDPLRHQDSAIAPLRVPHLSIRNCMLREIWNLMLKLSDRLHAYPSVPRRPQIRRRNNPSDGYYLRNGHWPRSASQTPIRMALAKRIIAQAQTGERDPERLCE